MSTISTGTPSSRPGHWERGAGTSWQKDDGSLTAPMSLGALERNLLAINPLQRFNQLMDLVSGNAMNNVPQLPIDVAEHGSHYTVSCEALTTPANVTVSQDGQTISIKVERRKGLYREEDPNVIVHLNEVSLAEVSRTSGSGGGRELSLTQSH